MSRGFKICLAKGDRGVVFKAELRAAEVDPRFEICRDAIAVLRIKETPPIFVPDVWTPLL